MLKIEAPVFPISNQRISPPSHPLRRALQKLCLSLTPMLMLGFLTPLHSQVHGLTAIGGPGGVDDAGRLHARECSHRSRPAPERR
jgi:hypothetical protein